MIHKFHLVLFFFISIGIISCNKKKEAGNSMNMSQEEITATLVEANKATIGEENMQIDKLIDSLGWKMLKTSTGLRYEIIEKGDGSKALTGNTAKLEYEIKLMNGVIVYSSKQLGPKEFRIGSGGVESGLEEGILMLKVGDKARFVIPSFLAHGLSGDQDKIPPKSTIIYTVKLLNLQ